MIDAGKIRAAFPDIQNAEAVSQMLSEFAGGIGGPASSMATAGVADAGRLQAPELALQPEADVVVIPEPSALREQKILQTPVTHPAIPPPTTAPKGMSEQEYYDRVSGVAPTWRDSILGMVGSKALSLAGGMLQGVVDLVRLVSDNDTLRDLSEALGKPVEEEAKRAAIQYERSLNEYGLAGRGLALVTNTALDIALFLLSLKASGLSKLLNAPRWAHQATRGAKFMHDVTRAAKFAALRFATTPGTLEEKSKTAALSLAFMSTSAFSGQLGKVKNNVAKTFLERLWKNSVIPADFALNSLVTAASGQYREALERGQAEADAMGQPDMGLMLGLLNTIPLVGTDAFFSAMTRGFWYYEQALHNALPPEARAKLGELGTSEGITGRQLLMRTIEELAPKMKGAGINVPDDLSSLDYESLYRLLNAGMQAVQRKKSEVDVELKASEEHIAFLERQKQLEERRRFVYEKMEEVARGVPPEIVLGVATRDASANLISEKTGMSRDMVNQMLAVSADERLQWYARNPAVAKQHIQSVIGDAGIASKSALVTALQTLNESVRKNASRAELASRLVSAFSKYEESKSEKPPEKAPGEAESGGELPGGKTTESDAEEGAGKSDVSAERKGEGHAVQEQKTNEISAVEASGSLQKVEEEVRSEDSATQKETVSGESRQTASDTETGPTGTGVQVKPEGAVGDTTTEGVPKELASEARTETVTGETEEGRTTGTGTVVEGKSPAAGEAEVKSGGEDGGTVGGMKPGDTDNKDMPPEVAPMGPRITDEERQKFADGPDKEKGFPAANFVFDEGGQSGIVIGGPLCLSSNKRTVSTTDTFAWEPVPRKVILPPDNVKIGEATQYTYGDLRRYYAVRQKVLSDELRDRTSEKVEISRDHILKRIDRELYENEETMYLSGNILDYYTVFELALARFGVRPMLSGDDVFARGTIVTNYRDLRAYIPDQRTRPVDITDPNKAERLTRDMYRYANSSSVAIASLGNSHVMATMYMVVVVPRTGKAKWLREEGEPIFESIERVENVTRDQFDGIKLRPIGEFDVGALHKFIGEQPAVRTTVSLASSGGPGIAASWHGIVAMLRGMMAAGERKAMVFQAVFRRAVLGAVYVGRNGTVGLIRGLADKTRAESQTDTTVIIWFDKPDIAEQEKYLATYRDTVARLGISSTVASGPRAGDVGSKGTEAKSTADQEKSTPTLDVKQESPPGATDQEAAAKQDSDEAEGESKPKAGAAPAETSETEAEGTGAVAKQKGSEAAGKPGTGSIANETTAKQVAAGAQEKYDVGDRVVVAPTSTGKSAVAGVIEKVGDGYIVVRVESPRGPYSVRIMTRGKTARAFIGVKRLDEIYQRFASGELDSFSGRPLRDLAAEIGVPLSLAEHIVRSAGWSVGRKPDQIVDRGASVSLSDKNVVPIEAVGEDLEGNVVKKFADDSDADSETSVGVGKANVLGARLGQLSVAGKTVEAHIRDGSFTKEDVVAWLEGRRDVSETASSLFSRLTEEQVHDIYYRLAVGQWPDEDAGTVRAQPLARTPGFTVDQLAEEARGRIEAAGGTWERGSGDHLGTATVGGLTIEFELGYPRAGEVGVAGTVLGSRGKYIVTINRETGGIDTVSHELGHIVRDVLTEDERDVIRNALGVDLNTQHGDELFARMMETENGRKYISEKVAGLPDPSRNLFVRAINRLIDFVNAVFGTRITRLGGAGDLDRLATGLRDMSVLSQLRRPSGGGEIGPRAKREPELEEGEEIDYEMLPPTYREFVQLKKNRELKRAFDRWKRKHHDAMGTMTAVEAWQKFLSDMNRKRTRPNYEKYTESEDVIHDAVKRAGALKTDPVDPNTMTPVRHGFMRRALDAISDAASGFLQFVPVLRLLSPALAGRYEKFRREVGQQGDQLWARWHEMETKMRDLMLKVRRSDPVTISCGVGGDPITGDGAREQNIKVSRPVLMTMAMQILSERANAKDPGEFGLADNMVIEKPANGQAGRVIHLDEQQKSRIIALLTPDERKALEEVAQFMDNIIYKAVRRVRVDTSGVDLGRREFYLARRRDVSFRRRPMTSTAQESKNEEEWFKLVDKYPLMFGVSPQNKSFLKVAQYNKLPLIVEDFWKTVNGIVIDASHYVKAAQIATWLRVNLLDNHDLVSRLSAGNSGRAILSHIRDLHDRVGGVINLGLDAKDAAIYRWLSRATIARLGSIWVWLKQPMSMFAAANVFGLPYLKYAFSKNDDAVEQVLKRSAYLYRRRHERAFDVFMARVGPSEEEASRGSLYRFGNWWATTGMQMGDFVAIRGIIKMAARYVSDHFRHLRGDEYWDEVARWADIAVQRTQVATDALDRTMIERNVTSPFTKMIVYMYGAKAKQYNLVLESLRNLYRSNDPAVRKRAIETLIAAGLMQSAAVAFVDYVRSELRGRKREDEVDEDFIERAAQNAAYYGALVIENLIGTAPLANEFLPSISGAVFSAMGEREAMRYRSARIGQGGIFSQAARDLSTFASLARQFMTLEGELRSAQNHKERRAIRQRFRKKALNAIRVVARIAGELSATPFHHAVLEVGGIIEQRRSDEEKGR